MDGEHFDPDFSRSETSCSSSTEDKEDAPGFRSEMPQLEENEERGVNYQCTKCPKVFIVGGAIESSL